MKLQFLILIISTLAYSQKIGFKSSKHILLIGIDGLGELYMYNSTSMLPNIKNLFENGAHGYHVRDRNPSISAPNWATILTGQYPEQSGIIDNDWNINKSNPINTTTTGLPPVSGMGEEPYAFWKIAKKQNNSLKTASVYSWKWIENLDGGALDFKFYAQENDELNKNLSCQIIEQSQPELMFIHFDSVDDTGHIFGWGSEQYYKAAVYVDQQVGDIINTLKKTNNYNDTLIIITADHGGYRKNHGDFNEANMYIPALYIGKNIRQNYNITAYHSDTDFVPTILNAIGLDIPDYLRGKVMEEIYENDFDIQIQPMELFQQ